MKDLSILQEYLICAVNEKGKISGFSTEKLVCFVAGGLLELKQENSIMFDDKKIVVTGLLPDHKEYLKSLYDYIQKKSPVKIVKILEEYNYSVTDKRFNELLDAVGSSLERLGLVETKPAGIFGNRTNYIPKKEAVNYVIDKVRAEVLEEGEITDEVAALVILLDRSKSLTYYFSEHEQKEMKVKIAEIVDSPDGKIIKEMVEYVESMIVLMTSLIVSFS